MEKYISIITINLNNKKGLEESIKSLISQNQKNSIEYIVVDGLSTDGSRDVIERYKNFIDKVVIEKDNGIFDAMNKGIEIATGEYIYFLNSGDEFASDDVIKKVIKAIDSLKEKPNIIAGKVANYKNGKFLKIPELYPWIVHQSAFVRKDLIKNYKFDSNFKVLGDLDLWRRMYNDDKYNLHKLKLIIANMDVEGIGVDPKYIWPRIREKYNFAKKHKDYLGFIATFFNEMLDLVFFKLCNDDTYHAYIRKKQQIKKIIRSKIWK